MAKHSNAKLIIELSAKGMSGREIARTRHISAHTIKEVLDRASEKGLGWDDVSLLGDDGVAAMLFPEDKEAEDAVARPDYGYVHGELRKAGVTLKLLWEEYRDECAEKGKIATAVIAKLRDREFATLAELNAAIRERLGEYNARPFQKREGSRKLVFEEVEGPMLAPLPAVPFEVCDWVYGRKVNLDFHVVYNTNRYSAPYRLVGKKVDLKVTGAAVGVHHGGERVATHPRCKFIRSVLASGAAGSAGAAVERPAERGGYVRGASYYAGGAR